MRKNYLMSMMVIGVTLAMVGLGTFAYFTTTTTIQNNQINTGVFTIYENVYDTSFAPATTLSISNVIPSTTYKKMGYIFVANDKSSVASATFTIDLNSFQWPTPSGACSAFVYDPKMVNMTLVADPTGTPVTWTGYSGYTQNYLGYSSPLTIPAGAGDRTAYWFIANSPPVSPSTHDYTSPAGYPLGAGQYAVFGVNATLWSGVTDTCWANQNVKFNIVVTATQVSS